MASLGHNELTHWGRDKMADIFQTTFSNAFPWMKMFQFCRIKISSKFVSKGPINNNPALVQIMAWRRSGDKPLSEPMMASLLTHICVTRPQWVNIYIFHSISLTRKWVENVSVALVSAKHTVKQLFLFLNKNTRGICQNRLPLPKYHFPF